MAVRPNEDRVVPRRRPRGDTSADLGGDPVGLVRGRRERLEPDRRGHRIGTLGAQSLADAGAHLEPVRVVEPHQPIGRIEDGRLGAVVPAKDDGPRGPVSVAEPEDVVDRRAPERVDRLVVVADHRDVPMRLGQQPDELGLGAVRVLELVDEDVPEPAGDLGPGRRRLADEAQGQRDLVAEVDAAVRREQRLIRGVGLGELPLAAGLLRRGIRAVAVRFSGRRPGPGGGLGHGGRLRRDAVRELAIGGRADVLVLAPAEQRRERSRGIGWDRRAGR